MNNITKVKHRNNPKRQCNYVISNTTLDIRHKNQLSNFEKKDELLKEYEDRNRRISSNLSLVNSKPRDSLTDEEMKLKTIYSEELNSIQDTISNLQNDKDELEYFINTSDILFDYYNLLENNTDETANQPISYSSSPDDSNDAFPASFQQNNSSATNTSTQTIAQYFLKKSNDKISTDSNLSSSPVSKNKASRFHLLDDYLRFTDKNYINNNIASESPVLCSYCKNPSQDLLINESIMYCRQCFTVENIITDNEKPSYKDPPKEISYFSYKRINHFSEWLNQIQGKETTDIPEEVFNSIILELNKQRIYDLSTVTPLKIREILKKNKINKYYEHIPYILNKITGIPNPHLNPDLEDKLKNMFREIQVPFLKFSPSNRKNFLSYSYVLHKFIQLLNEHEFLRYFPLLKSRDKLHQQEQIWKKICESLGWTFIRSI